jgi:sugar phosphate isomerase/epimerase
VWGGILTVYDQYGVRFAHELHPKEVVYETWTARKSIEMFRDYRSWGFNLDTGNLTLAGVDLVEFIREFGEHILYVHAKDVEQARHATRDHFLARPDYGDVMRNFRFRVPGSYRAAPSRVRRRRRCRERGPNDGPDRRGTTGP